MSYRNPSFPVWISQKIKGQSVRWHYVGMVKYHSLDFVTEQYEMLGWRVKAG